jgi:nucleoside-diphosphate-sugar epimerase
MLLPRILRGEAASYHGDLDAAHSWTYTQDVARTLVAAAQSDLSWGRAWHVPSNTAI